MHRVLSISEILHIIFACLNDGYTAQTGLKGNPTLHALSRTCRTFKEPALDALWRHIITLDPVIKCLGKEAWKYVDSHVPESVLRDETSSYKASAVPSRPLTPEDWSIIRKYIPRVRKLSQAPMVPFCPETLKAIQDSFPHGMYAPLFPNIRSLDWSQMLPKDLREFPFLYTCDLDDLSIGVNTVTRDLGAWTSPEDFLDCISFLCPYLKSALVFKYGHVLECVEKFSRGVRWWKYLRSLTCEDLTAEGVAYLAGLPTLTRLTFVLGRNTRLSTLRSLVVGRPFANLTSVSIVLNDLDLFAQFVSSLSLSPIDVELFVTANNTCSSRMEDVIRELAAHGTRRHVEKLWVVQSDYSRLPPLSNFAPRAQVLTIDSFGPLYKFTHLHTLHIDAFCAVKLTDPNLIELALTFPCLEDFHVNANYGWQWEGKPTCTFYGLYALLYLCPRLHTLGIEFDAADLQGTTPSSDVPKEWHFPIPPPPNTAITHLTLGESVAEDALAVAELLYAVMPNLRSVTAWCPESTTPDDDIMHLAYFQWQTRVWQTVEGNLEWLRHGEISGPIEGEDMCALGNEDGFQEGEDDDGDSEYDEDTSDTNTEQE